ncbi:MAG TPA: maleylpyruvate isomerase family mycothiol-dependent enzyme [Ornithinibacter sp.]|nr:maleylpyruvate isomerase family mycothiol-dependent enzyme [Ornithinibacter sp.]
MTPEPPTVGEYLRAVTLAVEVLASSARDAGLEAPVPTCPGWTVRDLLAHQGMVHRWATAIVRGADPVTVETAAIEASGLADPDPVTWLEAGATDLVDALTGAPDDLDALVFLREAPPARRFWARRQCHETTVHALDGLSARLGRHLTARDASWVSEKLAVDGIDELLVGFWQRRTKGLRSQSPYTAAVSADTGDVWLLEVGPRGTVTRHLQARDGIPSQVRWLHGGAPDLYLALWNRGGTVGDPTGLLPAWREGGAITW